MTATTTRCGRCGGLQSVNPTTGKCAVCGHTATTTRDLVTDIRDGQIVDLLTGIGATTHAARHIAGDLVRGYLGDGTVRPDLLNDLTDDLRGAAFELTLMLTRLARAAGHASCPDLGKAADHAATAIRAALTPTARRH